MSGQIFEKSISSLHRILDMECYAFNIEFYSRYNQDSRNQMSRLIISYKELLLKS